MQATKLSEWQRKLFIYTNVLCVPFLCLIVGCKPTIIVARPKLFEIGDKDNP